MTDTANAPERIWAFHAGPMVGLFIGKKEVGTNVSEYILATHCDELVAAARADGAREAQAKIARLTMIANELSWSKKTRDISNRLFAALQENANG